ncbi:ABC transporter permease [Haladaptatus pallidirubidus]|uniref:ABC transporter permease n=2 Tax=Haladaptatus pallidirubidus TaxID=1008152 RepID=UPI001D0FDA91|nr:ABC transporter permease [Haladaptatus pallidirubidus]
MGALIILFYILLGTIGVVIIPEPTPYIAPNLVMPFQYAEAPLGTDNLGRSVAHQAVHATPAMLQMITAGAVFSTAVATAVGTSAGYKSGTVDRVLMTITDVLMTIPGLPLVIVLAVLLEPRNPWVVGVVLTVNAWSGLARAIRSQVLTIRSESYVEASRLMGVSTPNILMKDVIPPIMPYIMVNFVNSARTVIFSSVGLYFLGILPFTNQNWGVMMNLAYTTSGALTTWQNSHWIIVPMIMVILLSFGLILFAQGTDRIFNPRIIARHTSSAGDEIESNESQDSGATSRIQG